jgi:hypothetical protein
VTGPAGASEGATTVLDAPAPAAATPGRIVIASRAISTTARAVVAEELHVAARGVRVDLADDRGLLALRVVSPWGLPLDDVIDRVTACRDAIRTRVTAISGRDVGRVSIRLTVPEEHLTHERRVQ